MEPDVISRRRILVVATAPLESSILRGHARELGESGAVKVCVVAPASKLSRLEWLANDEDAARAEAETTAERTGATVEEEPGVGDVEVEVGDSDPIQAAEDALATFPADELVAILSPTEEAGWLERSSASGGFERLGIPVRYVVTGPTRSE